MGRAAVIMTLGVSKMNDGGWITRSCSALGAGCLAVILGPCSVAEEVDPAIDVMMATFEFSAYHGNNILPEQIPRKDWSRFFVVDTRRSQDYGRAHIPGAVQIEWREVLARRKELPVDRSVLLYCDTGSLSAQAAFALRAAGRDDVYVLTGGFDGWNLKGGLAAHERAQELRSR